MTSAAGSGPPADDPHGLAATPVCADGTPESVWQPWLAARAPWSRLDLDVDRLVVLGAHPDDEVLGAGGIMTSAARAGIDVVVVCMSDGSASHPGSPTLTPDQLAGIRHAELDTATDLLDIDRSRWFGLPDGSLCDHHHSMAGIVDAVLDERPHASTALLSVWSGDGHPDHEAVGRCAADVAERRDLPLSMYPIWMWHWASPDDPTIPWDRMQVHHLDPTALAVKHTAIHAFDTQVRPLSADPADGAVLPPHILAHLIRPWEFVFV